VELAFQHEVASILERATVTDHRAITAYASIWEIRAQFACRPPEDVVLRGISSGPLTKDQEEIIEGKWGAFSRRGSLPGRFAASIEATREHDFNMTRLGSVRWGVLRTSDCPGFVCPGSPAGELYIPLPPRTQQHRMVVSRRLRRPIRRRWIRQRRQTTGSSVYDADLDAGSDNNAIPFFERACKAGEPKGCTGLGIALKDGRGIAKDNAKAVELLDPACAMSAVTEMSSL
jgi:hypothetical protein